MRIAVLGTGMVGRAISEALAAAGHEVVVGTRDPAETRARPGSGDSEGFEQWLISSGATLADFASAASASEMVFNATNGKGSLPAIQAAGVENLAGKVLVDISNALDFSAGFPPTLFVKDTDSLAEQVQRAAPDAHVVKALNMLSAPLMLHPERLPEPSTLCICGNDSDAKAAVTGLLSQFGWSDIIDLGDLSCARAMEMWLPLWIRLMGAFGGPFFNLKLVR